MNLFERLKRTEARYLPTSAGSATIKVQLLFDEAGAYLEVVDADREKVVVDYRHYRGRLRELLKAINVIERQAAQRFVWDDDATDRIYLHEHEHLIWMLRECEEVVDEQLQPLVFDSEISRIQFRLVAWDAANDRMLAGQLWRRQASGAVEELKVFRFVNENHVQVGTTIHEVQPIGENFAQLSLFMDVFPRDQLEHYLSLLYSYFTHIDVKYGDFAVSERAVADASPSILFQKITDDGSLHLDIVNSLAGFSDDFFKDYDVSRIASVNEMEATISIRRVQFPELDAEKRYLTRLLNRHQKKMGASAPLYYADEEGYILEPELAATFLSAELPELLKRYILLGAEKLSRYKIKPVKPKLSVKLGYGIDFLEGNATLEVEGEHFSLLDVLAQYRKHSYITLSDETHAVIHPDYLARLTRIFQKQGKKGVKVSFFDLPMVDELIEQNAGETQFPKVRAIFRGFNELENKRIKHPPINGKLRPYQLHGLKWINYLHTHQFGGCLADDMGLGKTIQTIAMLSRVYPKETVPSMLIMPRSLLFNWQKEIQQFCPQLSTYTYYGPDRDMNEALGHQVVMTTYGTLQRSIEEFKECDFHYVILDESQAIKNSQTQTTRAILLLRAKHRLALSGTPVENNLQELYSLFRFLNPSMFGSLQAYNRDYALPIHQNNDKNAIQELRQKVYPFILRRLKKDVLQELPAKTEQILYVDMSSEQAELYAARQRFHQQTIKMQVQEQGLQKSRFSILAALLELRQLASIPEDKTEGAVSSPKRELLIETVRDSVMNGHKVLVFANFLAAIDLMSTDLEQADIPFLTMTGATRDRQSLVNQFQNDDQVKVFLMTLKTGGVGLNLTAADTVFIYDPWWNTAAETQAIDRTHRIGQTQKVFTYKLIMRDTIEEKILLLQSRKQEMFDQIISSDSSAMKSLTEEDIDQILGL